jgi:hypothetical protein
MAKTKTRSKKSSSGVTRCSDSTCRSFIEGPPQAKATGKPAPIDGQADDVRVEFQPSKSERVPLLIAMAIPLGLLAVAYALWTISDRLLQIGPLDRAAFGWIVVVPVALLAPGVAGLAWARLSVESRVFAALVVGAHRDRIYVLLALALIKSIARQSSRGSASLPMTGDAWSRQGLASAPGCRPLRRLDRARVVATSRRAPMASRSSALMTFAVLLATFSCAPRP